MQLCTRGNQQVGMVVADYSSLRVLRIFLASPGDLREERHAAKRVVEELNFAFCRQFDWHVELYGWEDTLPGSGRPQELINKDVADCNLFVGLLWRRWGQPTGKYSSGFEEEFELAKGRRSTTGQPEIWLCFKAVEAERSQDPGEQLLRVLAFRQKQMDAREVLFKEFQTTGDWEREFRKWLLGYVAELVKQARAGSTFPATQPMASLQTEAGWRRLLVFGVCDVPKGQICAAGSGQWIHAEHRQVMQVVIPPA